MTVEDHIHLFTGSSNRPLAQEVAEFLHVPLGAMEASRYPDGEIHVRCQESVRGLDVFVLQPTCPPVNESLMELLIMIDSLKRASANSITALVPYYGYARQDRKTRPREPITAKLVADLLTVAGANRVVAVDLHAGQIQGFFNIPLDNLTASLLFQDYFLNKKKLLEAVVVSPDIGRVPRTRILSDKLNYSLAIVEKRRIGPNRIETMGVIGDVKGKIAVLVDDMITTGRTLITAAETIRKAGASQILAACTHAVLCGNAVQMLADSPIDELVVTNTVPIPPEKMIDKITVLSVAPLLGEGITRIRENRSISDLFSYGSSEQIALY
jgi:ribose-phosphate pyrophosphokinase